MSVLPSSPGGSLPSKGSGEKVRLPSVTREDVTFSAEEQNAMRDAGFPIPDKHNSALTEHLRTVCMPMLTAAGQDYARSGWLQIYVADWEKGWATWVKGRGFAVVPSWVFDDEPGFGRDRSVKRGNELAAYYLAHELAHIYALDLSHDVPFQRALRILCPPEFLHYERIYQPEAMAKLDELLATEERERHGNVLVGGALESEEPEVFGGM